MPQSLENITSIWIANNLIGRTSIIDLSMILNEEYARYAENPNVFMEGLFTLFVANSGHLQIVGFEDGATPLEIEVQLPTTYIYDRDWDVYWTFEGSPRAHNEGDFGEGEYSILQLNLGESIAQSVWDQAISIADAMQDDLIGYGLFQNSNTFVTSVMWALGYDIPSLLPELTPTLVFNQPGVTSNIIQDGIRDIELSLPTYRGLDLTLVGDVDYDPETADPGDTPDVDVFNGGAGDDHLYGGAGDDHLSGGRGADFIEGGAGDDTIALGADDYFLIEQTDGRIDRHGTEQSADGVRDIVIIGEYSGHDIIVGGGPEDRIVLRINDTTAVELLGGVNFPNQDGTEGLEYVFSDWGISLSDNTLENSDIFVKYRLDDSNETTQLKISIYADSTSDILLTEVIIQNFSEGDFGITFTDYELLGYDFGEWSEEMYPIGFVPEPIYGHPDGWELRYQSTIQLNEIPDPYVPDYSGADDDSGVEQNGATDGPDSFDLRGSLTDTPPVYLDLLDGSDTYQGGEASDIIRGGGGNDIISTGGGSDWVEATSGNNIVNTGAGDDFIVPGTGSDIIDGGEGIDTIVFSDLSAPAPGSNPTGVTIFLFSDIEQALSEFGGANLILNVENVIGSAGDDLIVGSFRSNVLFGGYGNDIIRTRGGGDIALGGEGDDRIVGGRGSDILDGEGGIDTLVYANSDAAVSVSLMDGTATGGYATGDQISNFENVVGSNFDDALTGDISANRLVGGDGNDFLDGGFGDDRLIGGAGADIFGFGQGYGRDVIVDFEAGQDRIEIDMDLFFADSNILDAFDLLDEANGYASELANGSIRLTFGDDILIIREGDTPLSFADVATSIDFI